ncbi:hypothetical protein KCO_08775 [Pectobacterium brasiliense ICMP 19477]|jgi:hypothetical protein|uniref:Uncharacterized protein n=1 Tax=Pectobacterium brasiliense TaxID=180957 RepID=M4GWU2_9GAMM|nr:hypothetical protein KCO_08775 [Pectobacterium brasiliense]KMK84154.1 hypothetical protein KCO_08775 [Pectobacterium brasiliense ICMP 19477]
MNSLLKKQAGNTFLFIFCGMSWAIDFLLIVDWVNGGQL